MRLIQLSFSLLIILTGLKVNGQSAGNNSFPNSGSAAIMSTKTPTGNQFYINGSVLQWGTGTSGLNSPTLFLKNNTATTGRTFSINSSDAGALQIIDVTATNAIRFIINNSGNIGIGTSTPNTKVEIDNTTAGTSGLRFTRLTSGSALSASNGKLLSVNANGDVVMNPDNWTLSGTVVYNNNSGNVLVGSTTDNGNKFEVTGTIKGSTTITAGTNIVANANVISGDTAAFYHGINPILWSRSSSGNTSIGLYALPRTSTGTNNLAVGGYAMAFHTTGIRNTAIGLHSLYNSTTGSHNTGIGAHVLYANTTGNQNTGIGYRALVQQVSATGNTAGGYQSGYSISTGNYNTGVGWNSLTFLTTGSNNTAIGTYAGYAPSQAGTYSNTTLLGYKSGYALTSGNNNILLGYQAGQGITTGSNNILLGYNIDFTSATASNQLNIGNLIFGTGLDGTGTTIASGNVGIGTASPNVSSLLDLTSVTKGFLPPRMTTTEKTAITTPANGLIVHDISTNKPNYYNGTSWVEYGSENATQWGTTGSDIYYTAGKVGIGTASPATTLHVAGSISSPGTATGSEKFGIGAVSNSLSSTAIGANSIAQTQSTAIGANSNAAGPYSTAVGEGSYALGSGTVVGRGSSASNGWVAIGHGAIASHSSSIVIGGSLSSTASNQFLVGSSLAGYGIADFIIGTGASSGNANSYGGLKMKTTNGSGTNINGADLKFAGGSGTGSANGGYISFLTTAPGVSGTVVNPEQERLRITPSGYVGIGTINPQSLLSVNGTITAKKLVVSLTGWPDYVFRKDYKLPTLQEIEEFIAVNQHLPGVPSASEVEKNGVNVGENQAILLKKIEELTLLLINQDKEQKKLQDMIQQQNRRIMKLETSGIKR